MFNNNSSTTSSSLLFKERGSSSEGTKHGHGCVSASMFLSLVEDPGLFSLATSFNDDKGTPCFGDGEHVGCEATTWQSTSHKLGPSHGEALAPTS